MRIGEKITKQEIKEYIKSCNEPLRFCFMTERQIKNEMRRNGYKPFVNV